MVDQKVIANRDEPIPVIILPDVSGSPSPSASRSDSPRRLDRTNTLRSLHAQASSKLKEKLGSISEPKAETSKTIQNRMIDL